jgi:hypothetical protein
MLKAKDIVTGKIALTEDLLLEPYLFVYDDVPLSNVQEEEHYLAKAVNIILAKKKMGYRVVIPCYMSIITEHVVCMVKE